MSFGHCFALPASSTQGGGGATLNMDFQSGTLPSQVTFSRGTTGTYYNSSGVLSSAAINAPRFDYDPSGFAQQNLLTYSEQFNNAAWTQTGIDAFGSGSVANATTAPDGTLTADFLLPGVTPSVQRTVQLVAVLAAAVYTQSYYVKAGGYSKIAIRESSASGYYVSFDVSTGSILSSLTAVGTITAVGNGWFRCTAYLPSVTATWGCSLYVLPTSYTSGSPTGVWGGDSVSGVYVRGGQLNAGATALPYLATTSATAFVPTYVQQNLALYSQAFSNIYWGKFKFPHL